MNDPQLYVASKNSINADALTYAFARFFGAHATIVYEERRIKNDVVLIDRRQANIRMINDKPYLIDARLRKNDQLDA